MNRLEGKTALITGGGGAFGCATALLFAKEGADLLLGDINLEAMARVKAEVDALGLGRKVVLCECDVAAESQVKAMFAMANEALGRVDILINIAGYAKNVLIQDLALAEWQRMIDVNLTGTFLCCREVAEQMIARKSGKIVNTSSLCGLTNRPTGVNYAASKAGVLGITRTLAAQMAPYGVNVNAIAPGPIKTSIMDKYDPKDVEQIMSAIRFARWGSVEDIANLILFLSCEEGGWITGETITINGGAFMG